MTRWEKLLSGIYLILQLMLLPGLLAAANRQLPSPLGAAQLNFVFFSLNFICILAVCHRFLWGNLLVILRQPGRFLGAVALGFVGYWAANLAMSQLLFALSPDFANVNDRSIALMVEADLPLMAAGTILLVPTVEETLYRGLLFGSLYRRSRAAAYVLSTLAFCAIHVVGYLGVYSGDILLLCFLQYIPAGLCLSWAYAQADSVFAPILIHTLINAIGICAMR